MGKKQNACPIGSNNYVRLDIQGLRAISVLAVIFFHLGFPVDSGFTGVDAFFVISGFLITRLLLQQYNNNGRINLKTFYLRRYYRLIPALSLTLVVSVLISIVLAPPISGQVPTAATALAAFFGVANIYLFFATNGYFGASAEDNALLNTWSLSVEEQFYLFLPLFLVLTIRLIVKKHSPMLTTLILSFVAVALPSFILMTTANSLNLNDTSFFTSFYSPFTRSWEFIIGSLIALFAVYRPDLLNFGRFNRSAMGLIALSILIISFFTIPAHPYPSLFTIVPVLSTSILLIVGFDNSILSSKILSVNFLSFTGNISYSLYLWHWPTLYFINLYIDMNFIQSMFFISFLYGIAFLSYKYVEQRFRIRSNSSNKTAKNLLVKTLSPIILSVLLLIALQTYYWKIPTASSNLLPGSVSSTHDRFHATIDKNYYPCVSTLYEDAPKWKEYTRCYQTYPEKQIDAVIIGDSHAEHLFPGFSAAYPNTNFAYYIVDGTTNSTNESFQAIITLVSKMESINTVILSSYWSVRGIDQHVLETDIGTLRDAGKDVLVFQDIPSFSFEPDECSYAKSLLVPSKNCTESRIDFDRRNTEANHKLKSMTSKGTNVYLVDPSDVMCNSRECAMSTDDLVLYRDSDHLSYDGSRFLLLKLRSKLDDLVDFS